MPNLSKILKFDSRNEHVFEHVLEHDLLLKKNFSDPKFYIAHNDLSKRWYVYFSYRNPKTGKLQRMKNFYGRINKFSTKEGRMRALSTYGDMLLELLNDGYNPFEVNTDYLQLLEEHVNKQQQKIAHVEEEKIPEPLIEKKFSNSSDTISDTSQQFNNNQQQAATTSQTTTETEVTSIQNKKIEDFNSPEQSSITLEEAFEFVIKIKSKTVSERTVKDYSNRLKKFKTWINDNYPDLQFIHEISKKHFSEFLNDILIKTSARNRNNYRADLAALFQTLEDNDIVETNEIKKIKALKSMPNRHQRYSQDQQEEIFEYLTEKDPILLLYIKFVSYNFLRPIEVNRLRIKDIDLKNKRIQFKAKNSPLKTKIIPELLFKELPDLSDLDPEYFLFTPDKIGGQWETTETNRRDNFTKRFKKVVKDHFGLDKNFSIYSFRHTFITKLYRELLKNYTPFEAKSNLMLITGHSSMTALEKYLRDIDAELPQDYSNLLKA